MVGQRVCCRRRNPAISEAVGRRSKVHRHGGLATLAAPLGSQRQSSPNDGNSSHVSEPIFRDAPEKVAEAAQAKKWP